MSAEENKAIVRYYINETWNNFNLSAVDAYVVPDYVQHVGEVRQGRDGVKLFQQMLHAAFPDIHNEIQDMVAEGDMVVWRSTITGTHQGPFRGLSPTGKSVSFQTMNFVRMQDGKFVENWGEQDNMGIMQQLGVIPKP